MIQYDPVLGNVKQCPICKEWWPADTEFFYKASDRKDGLHSYCRACFLEKRWPNGRGAFQKPKYSPWEILLGSVA